MKEMMKERAENYDEYNDLFTNLMVANAEDDGLSLSEEEVIGNIFIFLIGKQESIVFDCLR
jgi:cytochrome P450